MKIFVPIRFGSRLIESCRNVNCKSFVRQLYVQGQSPKPNVREYFYYIDHQGMVGIAQIYFALRPIDH